jgi:hypothetical protein
VSVDTVWVCCVILVTWWWDGVDGEGEGYLFLVCGIVILDQCMFMIKSNMGLCLQMYRLC